MAGVPSLRLAAFGWFCRAETDWGETEGETDAETGSAAPDGTGQDRTGQDRTENKDPEGRSEGAAIGTDTTRPCRTETSAHAQRNGGGGCSVEEQDQ
jgi:hypothetical protein